MNQEVKLKEAIKTVLEAFDNGLFVRSTKENAEPLLGPIDFGNIMLPGPGKKSPVLDSLLGRVYHEYGYVEDNRLHWIVVGGESGHGARPFYLDNARAIVEQCKMSIVPVFVKQLGRFPVEKGPIGGEVMRYPLKLKSSKGGNPDEWPKDLRVRQYPK